MAFPIPYVFPIFALFNGIGSAIVTAIIKDKFAVPAALRFFYTNIGIKGRFYNSVVQAVLIFSITSFTVLVTFHFAWVVLAFAAYPVRSLASQAFTIPFLVISFAVYFTINYVLSFPTVVFRFKQRSKKIAVALVSALLTVPFLIALLGVLFYYSHILVEVNDSLNYPVKTVIASLVPTVITGLCAWAFRNTLKAYAKVTEKEAETSNIRSNESNVDNEPDSVRSNLRLIGNQPSRRNDESNRELDSFRSSQLMSSQEQHESLLLGKEDSGDEELLPLVD